MMEQMDVDFDVTGGVRNKAGQELRIETRGSEIVFIVIDGAAKAEFVVSYNNKVIMEDIGKQFVNCTSHVTKINGGNLRKTINERLTPTAG
jgi:hypothetical protein